ncbi:MAG: glycosyltransferase [Actinobacteria bacterium]|nr:glycosyltransferase [Actinomycetota bacterium]
MVKVMRFLYELAVECASLPILLLAVVGARYRDRPYDVGIGPEPIVSHPHHRKALERRGYRTQTFVGSVYFITEEFDVRGDRWWLARFRLLRPLASVALFVLAVWRYRCVYHYFNGGPLGSRWIFLWRFEPHLLRLAGVATVVMPYGGDIQDLTRTRNLLFKDAMARDYPAFRLRRRRVAAQIDLWTRHASHLIGGCDWVEYLYHWDTLMLAHFSIDLEEWHPLPAPPAAPGAPLRVLHAPNHRHIKGSAHVVAAVERLRAEGVLIELTLLEAVPNTRVREAIAEADVVVDQLVIGWYAMFALEAMAMEKPVLCHLRPDFLQFYVDAGLVAEGEIPLIDTRPGTIEDDLRRLAATDREHLREIGRRSRAFAARHHSLDAVGEVFDRVNRAAGVVPHGG